MADDPDRIDPQGTMETVPPPAGEKDAYSAETRVGTLPEHILEAMRKRETDGAIEKRTKSGMRASAVRPLAPPPVPSFDAPAVQEPAPTPAPASRPAPPPLPAARVATPRGVRPSGQHRISAGPLAPPSPLAPLAVGIEDPRGVGAAGVVPSPPVTTPQDGWLAGASPLHPPAAPLVPPAPPPAMSLPLPQRRALARSLLVIAIFALLGGLVAAVITLAGY